MISQEMADEYAALDEEISSIDAGLKAKKARLKALADSIQERLLENGTKSTTVELSDGSLLTFTYVRSAYYKIEDDVDDEKLNEVLIRLGLPDLIERKPLKTKLSAYITEQLEEDADVPEELANILDISYRESLKKTRKAVPKDPLAEAILKRKAQRKAGEEPTPLKLDRSGAPETEGKESASAAQGDSTHVPTPPPAVDQLDLNEA